MHLTPEELVDLADGTRPMAAAPHLNSCEECHRQLNEMREVMASLAVDVPEPSPLFWDHLSARVHEAVAAEGAPRARWWIGTPRMTWILVGALSVVLIAIAASFTMRAPAPAPSPVTTLAEAPPDPGSPVTVDDPSFSLLGDLAGNLDWDTAEEAGITMEIGTADTAVADLSDRERTELQRLLREAMATS